jgi:hypothetical protein
MIQTLPLDNRKIPFQVFRNERTGELAACDFTERALPSVVAMEVVTE